MATYLRGRRFAVRIGSNQSSERAIAAGVVQGSKVGSKLFNIYINDSPSNCQTRLCLFADDTAIMSTGAFNNITNELNSNLDLLVTTQLSRKYQSMIPVTPGGNGALGLFYFQLSWRLNPPLHEDEPQKEMSQLALIRANMEGHPPGTKPKTPTRLTRPEIAYTSAKIR
ncbi:hypothetical protein AVEN_255945-1 [Araneus ventricosus]|uniref:Reverse transcriptase domain-containing protein n=1 Tax=Araneus ventricosus TaxID=182803 RepID=A0A4Y2KEF5_ARAVE|nr:hypothetical protein AVEN_255945-1 [Araneus ventricosus]